MFVSEFDFHLPAELIAQDPLPDRSSSRLLHLDRHSETFRDCSFRDFPGLLQPGDLVVFNNTKVFPARLYGRRGGTQAQPATSQHPPEGEFLEGRIEVLLSRQVSEDPNEWDCLVRPGRKIGVGERLFFGTKDELQATVVSRGSFGERRLRFCPVANFVSLLEHLGHVPLPPYINRPDDRGDRDRYQTIYARVRGSIAAPTAGLHFTPEILARMRDRNIETTEITLHVGLGTFQPVRVDQVEDHRLHREHYDICPEAAAKINRAIEAGRRVVAVGTTTVRTLEHAAAQSADGRVQPGSGEADLFIYPGYQFRVVKALLTNFHLPASTLLMLVSALAGRQFVMAAYRHAVDQKYRFFSYGDCMFVE